ncbi:MAG TPA: four helix bundle protein [bacterium]|jgi:four helix bundle protein|nr:four helix bundle protein [bacterium]
MSVAVRGSDGIYGPLWHHADELAQFVYRLTWKFTESDPALAQRMRSAALSAATSVVEACRLSGSLRARRPLRTADTALSELGYYLYFARRIGLIPEHDLRRAGILEEEVSRYLDPLLNGDSPTHPRPGPLLNGDGPDRRVPHPDPVRT